jgi:disulfide bond formation protein DsbB
MKILSLDKKFIPAILFLAAAIPLAAAYISEYGFGLKPCELCIMQRIPFFVVIGLTVAYAIFRIPQKFICYLVAACGLAFLTNAGIAFFHVGVEFKWWRFGECSANINSSSFEAFKAAILAAPTVRCDEPQFKFLGISMAGYNVLLNLFYSAVICAWFCSCKKCKPASTN